MPDDTLLARIARDSRLPSPPAVALQVLEKAGRPDCSLAQIRGIISRDPALCARLLKLVNSAFFAIPQAVTSIDRALNLLGLKRVRSLVISLALPGMQRRPSSDTCMRDYWKVSLAVAVTAREWAIAARLPDPENELVAGLLCDLGALVLLEIYPAEYGAILASPPEVLVRRKCELEEQALGLTHADVGADLLRRWGLPPEMTEAIRLHHRPDEAAALGKDVADRSLRLYFASRIAQLQLAPPDPALFDEVAVLARDRFGMDNQRFQAFLEPLRDKVAEFASLLQVDIGTFHHYPTLLASATEQLARLASETALENIRVHEQKEAAELACQQGQAELERLGQQHELILNAAGEGIFGLDRAGRTTLVNPAAARMLGWQREQLIGRGLHDFLRHAGPDGAPCSPDSCPIHGVLRDGRPRQVEDQTFGRQDGTTFPASCVCTPMYEGEELVGAVVIFRDLTEKKQAEEALRKSEHTLRQVQKMEAVGQLAGGVAHDFNNLLTIINGCSDFLLTGFGLNSAARELVTEIRKAGERAASLTRQLLAFSRKQMLAPQVLVLNTVVSDLEKMLRRLIGEDVKLASALAPDLGRVKADPGQVEQVLLNLVVNARDAMPRGGKLTIETANVILDETCTQLRPEVKPGRYVLLAVTDTGCGMTEEVKARIFEPFFTTKGPGKGTGLGLATVYGIVKQSDGYIYAYSEPGQGTCFKVYLPRADAPASLPAAAVPPSASPGGHETILLVEDDDSVRALARRILRSHSYSVLEACHGVDALRVAEEYRRPIHLLLTDVVMPEMSGSVLARHLTARIPNLKVLYISGYTDDAVVRHGQLGADTAFLQKPFTPEVLARKVREVLDQPAATQPLPPTPSPKRGGGVSAPPPRFGEGVGGRG